MTELTKQQRLRLKQRIVANQAEERLLEDTQEALANFMEHFNPSGLPVVEAVQFRAMLDLSLRQRGVPADELLRIEDDFLTTKYGNDERD